MIPSIPLAAVAGAGAAFAVQRVEQAAPWSFDEHRHRGFCEIAFLAQGRIAHRLGGATHQHGPGTLVFIRERDAHALSGDGLLFFNLNLPTAEWWRFDAYLGEAGMLEALDGAGVAPVAVLSAADRARCQDHMTELFVGQHDVLRARRLLASFLLAWLPVLAAGVERHRDPRPVWMPQLMDEVEQRLESGLRVEDLPRRAGVSSAHLARSFRRHLGCTPSSWLTGRRIERAALLLTHTERDIADIVDALGFASRSWFHAIFKRRHGVTPAAFRLRHAMRVAGSTG
jgi:AraC family transcriptional regulator, dual regulator of chb operon